jgi:uncharacterized membrane protein
MANSTPAIESHLRSVLKGLSYRSFATLSTIGISFALTGSIKTASLIGAAEAAAKILLFWGHERLWHRIRWGRRPRKANFRTRALAQSIDKTFVTAIDHAPERSNS